jgi:hypothetical protein
MSIAIVGKCDRAIVHARDPIFGVEGVSVEPVVGQE